ncbi:MAG TPA: glycerol-3-phosphate 1-O-acyltransferase PlsY [Opitutus sp.]|nr:glycerol-3-phosphate 1-O-acyltransferase PlsY [Opitutus sp.]
MILPVIIAAAVGYLLGSLPFGYLVARAKGVNIFEVGSRSPGATNVRRTLGSGPGNLVFVLDALKGALAVELAVMHLERSGDGLNLTVSAGADAGSVAAVAALLGALVGHSFSCFTKFRGGKGVATSMGGLLIMMPLETAIAGAAWVIVFFASRYVSLASITAAVVLVIASLLLKLPGLLIGVATAIALFVVVRHRTNIARLLNGTENKFVRKGAGPKA